ncbi:MAG: asparagine synthetase B, partial [Clostridia bacterium]|nr:asparagine synthetase B [Clostridia bacterium]
LKIVSEMLSERLKSKNSILNQIMDKKALNGFLNGENATWFGQLMAKPQLIAWLIQFDYWFDKYNIDII